MYSDNERVMGVGGSEGVLISVHKLERQYEENNLSRMMRQRADFPGVVGEVEASRVFSKNKGFLKVYLVDERSTNNSPVYYDFPGKARMCYNNVVLPFVWNEREKVRGGYISELDNEREIELFKLSRDHKELVKRISIETVSYTHLDVYKRQVCNNCESIVWGYEERELCIEREIELYKLKRNYDELRKILEDGVKMNHIKYLPVEREIENYFDNIFINNTYLR